MSTPHPLPRRRDLRARNRPTATRRTRKAQSGRQIALRVLSWLTVALIAPATTLIGSSAVAAPETQGITQIVQSLNIPAADAGGSVSHEAFEIGGARSLAQQIVDETSAGNISWLAPSNFPEIVYSAEGRSVPGCAVDPRILQVIQIAYVTFGHLGISDINRLCFNEHPPGSFDGDAHTANGGGHAVDFYSLGGHATTGADANAIRLLKVLDPVMPAGHAAAGQSECRAGAGSTVSLVNMTQFSDLCTHLHIQVDPEDPAPLAASAVDG